MSTEIRKTRRYILDAMPHLDALWRTATWITSSESEAEQLTENVYKAAYGNRVISSGSSESRTLLFRTLMEICSENKPWDNPITLPENIENYALSVDLDEFPKINIIPQELITDAIRNLPFEIRIVMVLSTIEGFSYSEIAHIFGGSTEDVGRMKQIGCIQLHKELLQSPETAPGNGNSI
jgi:DNA-directed RNA polymerase specialized sigma24 family protein